MMDRRHSQTAAAMRLIQLTDSALPVGTFSFSNGLETAAQTGLVHDAATLEEYVRDIVRQTARTDGIAALCAYRSRLAEDYDGIVGADRALMLCKLNAETRRMLRRMGRKLAELATLLTGDAVMSRWLGDVKAGAAEGSYPVAQGILFAACGISERGLFASHCYGAANMVLGAALRCVRVSHYDTQRILYRLGDGADALYDEIRDMEIGEMHAFAPQADILASMHEKGSSRMFMN